jgi:hypothetical protein
MMAHVPAKFWEMAAENVSRDSVYYGTMGKRPRKEAAMADTAEYTDQAFDERRDKARKVRNNLEPKLVAYMDRLKISEGGYSRSDLDRFNCAAALLSYLRGYYGTIPFMSTFMGQYAVTDEVMEKLADPDFTPIPIIEKQCSFLPGNGGEWYASLTKDDELWYLVAKG